MIVESSKWYSVFKQQNQDKEKKVASPRIRGIEPHLPPEIHTAGFFHVPQSVSEVRSFLYMQTMLGAADFGKAHGSEGFTMQLTQELEMVELTRLEYYRLKRVLCVKAAKQGHVLDFGADSSYKQEGSYRLVPRYAEPTGKCSGRRQREKKVLHRPKVIRTRAWNPIFLRIHKSLMMIWSCAPYTKFDDLCVRKLCGLGKSDASAANCRISGAALTHQGRIDPSTAACDLYSSLRNLGRGRFFFHFGPVSSDSDGRSFGDFVAQRSKESICTLEILSRQRPVAEMSRVNLNDNKYILCKWQSKEKGQKKI
ncbi:hypothetical protein C8R43DRAFT_957721 [Mycena crocata]|nr:hypothetical protein C8R43DRAFT_957721 [Mycena crocata]